jgi:GTP-binding protein HflX
LDVLLVSLTADMREIAALIDSAGHRIVDRVVQRRDHPDPQTFVGRGKLEEVKERIDRDGVDFVVFNGELRPTMHYHLEQELGVECYDRLRVLLELFAQRAATREAKLQVELALLHYEVPLLREWIHEADIGERPGFMAGGELRVDAYYETVKRRLKKIKDELETIGRERDVRRRLRKELGYDLVALAGYANAGKSSLLNALTGEHVIVESRMFSTLSTTTRTLARAHRRILVTDTIGFVDGVPFWMIEAFNATLEEIFQADLILLLIDASDAVKEIRRKVRLAARTLLPKVTADIVLPVLTKIDLLSSDALAMKAQALADSGFHRSPLTLSAKTGEGLEDLRRTIQETFAYPVEIHLVLPLNPKSEGKLHWLHERADVVSVRHLTDHIEAVVRCRLQEVAAVQGLGRVVLRADVSS